ncbi:MAG TPA: hypothetical protein PLP94_00755 [Candidatus Saccharicenans sp.]|nr:hypothetical protein [Candidatus Saccharicenans sp.]HOL45718.1 hypothetical protein [Candidatus Saccharicenans sp.]HOM93685.1 hypothetical protein [Candidatus Saccharicenans sp.]HOP59918.1 hypothetical protein [Candidatus Saccharicenans sp.]HOT68362.1 hypothetical protein [Candidatus Saccharicenans sp.]
MRHLRGVMLLVLVVWLAFPARSNQVGDEDLEKAVATMRNIVPDKMSKEEKEARAKELTKAWQTIQSTGEKGIKRLSAELDSLEKSKQEDDFFKLSMGALLWETGGLEQAELIARCWRSARSFSVNYQYVFFPAFAAAMTRDNRALPMLRALLRDKESSVSLYLHGGLEMRWPVPQEFVWGAFGPGGLSELMDIARNSEDMTSQETALRLLADDQYLEALPLARQRAKEATGELKRTAYECLGIFGHPDDFETLLAGLEAKNLEEVYSCCWALYEYGDARAVDKVLPLLARADMNLKAEICALLIHLPTIEGLKEAIRQRNNSQDEEEKNILTKLVSNFFKELEISEEDYLKKSESEQKELLAGWYARSNSSYQLGKGDRQATREEFLKAIKYWEKEGRIERYEGEYSWLGIKQMIGVARPEDLQLLLELKSYLYPRLSDECLSEIREVDEVIRYIGRSRYRKNPGICLRVETN